MFYKKGIDITNDKSMFEFISEHPTYYTMSAWNGYRTIAHNVKLYNLNLEGDWRSALGFLESGHYEDLNWMIHDWEQEHPGYEAGFNGRSGGYLILTKKASCHSVIPEMLDYETYEDYKADMRDYYGSVKANRSDLVFYTKLVQDFDKLCDQLRDYCDELSNLKLEVIEMEKSVDSFNIQYENDLEVLEFQELRCDSEGVVDLSEVIMLQSLTEAFLRLAKRDGYKIEWLKENGQPNNKVKLIAM